MTTADPKKVPDQWTAYNYCVSFIDLLGQRDALRGQGLLQKFDSEEERKRFESVLKGSIGSIVKLQERAEEMLIASQRERPDSPFRASLSPKDQTIWDEMQRTRITTQRWSDGLVSFACLGDQDIKCPVNAVFDIFGLAGSLCFMGLASKRPIRGAIDIAWGVEIRPGELYGAAVAAAYELESVHAQYPRIVVGERGVTFLDVHANNPSQDVYAANNRGLAELCLAMLAKDVDGMWILHYLGDPFRQAITYPHHDELYKLARKYIEEQLEYHRRLGNSKLAFRYSHLLLYFDAHRPNNEPQSPTTVDAQKSAPR